MRYIDYQKLNGGKPVTSKGKVRKELRLKGLGRRGGCISTSLPTTKTVITAKKQRGWKDFSDPYVVYCPDKHRNDYYPSWVETGDTKTCRTCKLEFVVE